MSSLDQKIKQFRKAINSLQEVLAKEKDDIIRDSTIQRFEYTYELCWKSAKEFLREQCGVDALSPKKVFRDLGKNNYISDEEVEDLIRMTDARNEIAHIYDEKLADKLYDEIRDKYCKLNDDVYRKLYD